MEKEEKIKQLFKSFRENYTQELSKDWFKFKVNITYEYHLKCTEEEILNQFSNAYEKTVYIERKLRKDRSSNFLKLKPTQNNI